MYTHEHGYLCGAVSFDGFEEVTKSLAKRDALCPSVLRGDSMDTQRFFVQDYIVGKLNEMVSAFHTANGHQQKNVRLEV